MCSVVLRQFLCAGLLLAAGPAVAGEKEKLKAADLQRVVTKIVGDVEPAVVRLTLEKKPDSCSGTIISADGLILTCAHIKAAAGDKIVVHTRDHKQHPAHVLAKSSAKGKPGDDIALARLDNKGPWPFVPVGVPGEITADTPLLYFGYPLGGSWLAKPDEPPSCYVRIGHRNAYHLTERKGLIPISCRGGPGDSGGPIVDARGHVIGVVSLGHGGGVCHEFNTVDLLRQRWKMLAGDRPAPALPAGPRPALPALRRAFDPAITSLRKLVVEVYSDYRPIASGLVVGPGLVLTKASELGPNLSVAFGDERAWGARAAATDHGRDLALLKIGRTVTQEQVPWAEANDLKRGTLLSVVTPEGYTPTQGIVVLGTMPVPPIAGALPVNIKNANGGVVITQEFVKLVVPVGLQSSFPLRVGDVITHVNGTPTPNLDAWKRLYAEWTPTAERPRIAGEPVTVRYQRDGKALESTFPLAKTQNVSQYLRASSRRFTGFPRAVIAQLVKSRPEHAGSPVIDCTGQVVGVYIAKSEGIEDLVLPAAEVKASLKLLLKLAKEKKQP
jgi:S1-C subfamily serine protease